MKPPVLPTHGASPGQKQPTEDSTVKALMALFATAFFSFALWTSVEAFLMHRPFSQQRSDKEYGHPLALTLSSWKATNDEIERGSPDESQESTEIMKSLDILSILDSFDNNTRTNEIVDNDDEVDVRSLERSKRLTNDDMLPVPSTRDINSWPGYLRFKNPPYPGYRECKPASEG